jgi:tetratricopeptide (TPR) repeat protein
VIGPYRVLRPIARGGMAEVYEVEHIESGEHLALKQLMAKGTALQRFNREYEAMIRLNHPNIVRVYHYGLHDGMPWLTMELLRGDQVQVAAKNAGRPGDAARNREVIRIAHDVARALDHIHRRGLVHRDLKSANVLVLPDGRVKILDFGTTRLVDGLEAITKPGEFLGTLHYAAPEQVRGKDLDGRADLYALGTLMYRLLSGVLPFQTDNLNQLAKQVVRDAPKPIRELVPGVPEELAQLVHALLEKKPEDRPQSGGAVADRLEAIAGEPLVLPGTLGVTKGELFGREGELASAKAFLDRAGAGSVLLVTGGPGSGHEAIAKAVQGDAAARGWRVLAAAGSGGDDATLLAALLGPVAASFGEDAPPRVRTAKAALDKARDASGLPASKRREILRSLATMLLPERARMDGKPILAWVSGLDAASASFPDLLASLASALGSAQPAVLLAADASEAADVEGGLLRAALPRADRVNLGRLDVRQTALLVGSLLHRRPPPAPIARQIRDAAGGEPAYVEDVVRGMVDRGFLKVLGRDPNRLEWSRREGLDIPIAAASQARIQALVEGVPADRRRVLEALAVAPGPMKEEDLASVLERAVEEVHPALAELRDKGLASCADDAWELAEPLARPLVLETIRPERLDLVRRRLLAAAQAAPPNPGSVRVLAQAGEVAEAVRRALEWGDDHLRDNRPVTALEALDEVSDLAEGSGAEPDVLAAFWLINARCLLMARPTDPGIAKSLQRAAALAEGPLFAAELSLTKARVQRVIGHYPNYRALLLESWQHLKEAGLEPNLGAEIAERLGSALHLAGLMVEAGDWLKRARALAVKSESSERQIAADVSFCVWLGSQGRLKDAERTLAKLVEKAEAAEDERGLAAALPAWCDTLRLQGRYSEALARLDRRTPHLRHGESAVAYVRLLVATAWCEIELCRLGRAQECVDELLGTLRLGEHLHLRLEAELVQGRILLASGRLREARATLTDVWERSRSAELVLLAEHARALLAETLAALGKRQEAEAHFRGACQRLEGAGDVVVLAAACVSRARGLAGSADASVLLAPVRPYAESQPATILRLEWHLAHGRYRMAKDQDPKPAFEAAKQVLDKIAARLDETDRAALRVHPWTREIRAAGIAVV